jgi:hypothetical protein
MLIKIVGTCGKNGIPETLFKYNPAGKRDVGRPQKRRENTFLI